MNDVVQGAVATVFRDEWGQILATLIRLTGNWDLAEDSAQDALRWPCSGGLETVFPAVRALG